MRFEVEGELRLFSDSVRTAIAGWEPPREAELGAWQDDRDDELTSRLEAAGWSELAASADLLGPAVVGGIELGRAAAPLCVLDEATLGAPLWVDGRARHGLEAEVLAVPRHGGGLALGTPRGEPVPEATLDGSGTVRVEIGALTDVGPSAAAARWRAWSAASLGYLAGLGSRALELAVEHARSREQFGAPLAALPAVRSRLADALLVVDATTLLAWASDDGAPGLRAANLLWAGSACSEVTASAIQVHGAIGFALESGLHRAYRRARATESWLGAVCAAAR